jgi:hypothetical protein
MVILTPKERNSASFISIISQVLNVSTFSNMADVYAIVHLLRHPCQHITIDHICCYCLLAANQGNYVRGLFLKKPWRVSLSIDVRIAMIRCVFCLLRIFKIFHGLMNNPVFTPCCHSLEGRGTSCNNERNQVDNSLDLL